MAMLLRTLMVTLVTVGLLVSASCTTAGTPTPSTSGKTAASPVPSAPAEKATSVSKPAATASAQPAASADWKAEWDKTVAAAKQEGKLVGAIPRGITYRNALTAFSKSYPEIQLQFEEVEGSTFAPKLLAERDGGLYLWDVYVGGATSALDVMKPKGIWESLRQNLLLPEVLDTTKWVGGFDDPWQDQELKYLFGFEGRLFFIVYVNRDFVPESELSSIDQLLDPKWKGKIAGGEPRLMGTGNGAGGHLLSVKGEDWLRKLYSQDLVIIKDERQLADSLIRGKYPIAVGLNPGGALDQYRAEGVGLNVKPLDPESVAGASLSSSRGNLGLYSKAAHPNAAKVFVNWLLSKEGMQAYVDATGFTTRRLDVPSPDEYKPKPGVQYRDLNKDAMVPFKNKVIEIAKDIFK